MTYVFLIVFAIGMILFISWLWENDRKPLTTRQWDGHYYGSLNNDFAIEWVKEWKQIRIDSRYPLAISGEGVICERGWNNSYIYKIHLETKEVPTSLKFRNETFYLNDDGTATVFGH